MSTIPHYLNKITGKPEPQEGIGGAVNTMPAGITRPREEDALDGTRKAMTWPSPGIFALQLQISGEAQTTADTNAAAFCFGAANDAVADAWLTAGDSLTVDSQRHVLRPGTYNYVFSSPILRLDMKRDLGADALRVVAVGVG